MPRKSLERTLSELEDELADAGELGGEQRMRVEAALGRVRMLLDEHPTEELPKQAEGLFERLQAEHPALTSLVGRLADALSTSGF